MRVTGPLWIALGLLMLFASWAAMGTGVITEGLDLSIRNNARDLSHRLTPDELSRAFSVPLSRVPDDPGLRTEWLEDRLEREWASSLRSYMAGTAIFYLLLAIGCLCWGSAEIHYSRRRRTAVRQ